MLCDPLANKYLHGVTERCCYIVKDSSRVHSESFSYGYNSVRAAASTYS